ncbi:MAG TPA: hypothetical protein VGN07_22900 [Steroidobacteraceae bacterium]
MTGGALNVAGSPGILAVNTFERGARGNEPTFGPNGALASDPLWPVPFALPDQHGVHDSRTTAEYWSVFAEATWSISPRLQLITGLRLHREDREASKDAHHDVGARLGAHVGETYEITLWGATC